jgi:APA family basic amino acid/polyamine antiporter
MTHPHKLLGLGSGIGLVVANMVGAGVFISAGFMVQDMGPGAVLAAWIVGAVIALSGARAYATVAAWVPRSGGEYRFLSDLLHPALGYLAGWASLLIGFSAPLAIDALVAGSFAATIAPGTNPTIFGALTILALTLMHAVGLRASKWTHNVLVTVDGVLLTGFVIVGLVLGHNAWPTWTPTNAAPGFPLQPFMQSLFFIAFAFSGWNAAAYAASEFKNPRTDVPRAMLIGCGLVAVLYLIVNWVFVANLTPAEGKAVFEYEQTRVTLGHVVVRHLLGDWGGRAMSVLALVAFISAASAMTMVGPRVYAAMAEDGFLPHALAAREGRPPVWSVILQAAIALVILLTHTLQQVLTNVGAILTLFAALTSFSVFKVWISRSDLEPPSRSALAAAFIHVASAVLMLYFGFRGSTHLLLWLAVVAAFALAGYAVTAAIRKQPPQPVALD